MRALICFGFLVFVGTAPLTLSAQSPLATGDAASAEHTDNADAKVAPYTISSRSSGTWVDRDMGSASGKPITLPEPRVAPPSDGKMELLFGAGTLKASGSLSILTVNGTQRAFVPWSPLFLLPPSPFGLDTSTFEMHARQSNFQLLYDGPQIEGWKTGALTKLYMSNSSLTSDTYGILPIVAFGEMRNDDWRFAIGLQPDLFAPRDPGVIPMTLMGGAGNAGTFRGQIRLERFYTPSDDFQATLQAALSDPISTVLLDATRRTTEANGWPNLEIRGVLGLGAKEKLVGGRTERPVELGVAGLVGQIRNTQNVFDLEDINPNIPVRSVINVDGLSVDGKINLTANTGLIGEGYIGQGLGNYAGNIFQTYNPETYGVIRGRGGFLEMFHYWNDRLQVHAGYGVEGPLRQDLPAVGTGIFKNSAYFASMFWDVTKFLQYSFQVDYRHTDYVTLNDNRGVVFYNQFVMRY
ncbi:MAG: hypothetical protein NTY15_11020 [Planctomycetota bacterium]|nr:hypothetical protein [Planctomycetota bacterium]